MAQNWPKLKKIENNLKFLKFSDIDFYMSKYYLFNILVIFVQKIDLKLTIFCLILSFTGKPENDLGRKMVQVCIKENGPGFQNIEIDRKMV